MPRYWSILDSSVIHLRRNNLFKTVIPSKMFESFAMGIPILHGVEGESAEIIEKTGAGVLFEAENPRALADLIEALESDPEQLEIIKRRGLEHAPLFDRTALAREMLRHLEKLL